MASAVLRRPPEHAAVISVRNDVALVGAAVHALRECVGRAELKAAVKASVPSHLQRVVHRIRDVIRSADRAEAFVRPNSVEIRAGIGSPNRKSWLVDVRLALQVQAAASDIGNAEDGFPE